MHAVDNNRTDIVRYFLYNYNCESFYKNNDGYSALLLAVKKGFTDCLKYILKKDTTVNEILSNLKKLRSLYSAKDKLYYEIDELIIELGELDPGVLKLFSELNKIDDIEKNIYSNLDRLDFEQIILCFKNTSNPIIQSLLINTFDSYDELISIYTNMTSGDVV